MSDDGRWVAWIVARDSQDLVKIRLADRSCKARDVMRATEVSELQFSPDSKWLGVGAGTRLWAYNIHDRESVKAASGNLRGFSFSPDSKSVAFGTAGRNESFDSPSDLYSFEIANKQRTRITRDRKSLNPLWTESGIIHDRQRIRENAAPSYNLFEIQPDGGSLRRITKLRIPSLSSGLVPLEMSANGNRMIAAVRGPGHRGRLPRQPRHRQGPFARRLQGGRLRGRRSDGRRPDRPGDKRRSCPGRRQPQRGDDALPRRQADPAGAESVRSGLVAVTGPGAG